MNILTQCAQATMDSDKTADNYIMQPPVRNLLSPCPHTQQIAQTGIASRLKPKRERERVNYPRIRHTAAETRSMTELWEIVLGKMTGRWRSFVWVIRCITGGRCSVQHGCYTFIDADAFHQIVHRVVKKKISKDPKLLHPFLAPSQSLSRDLQPASEFLSHISSRIKIGCVCPDPKDISVPTSALGYAGNEARH